MENLQQLFEGTLKDVYYAEKAILKALPKMAKKATSEKLRAAFEEHLEQTEDQVARLEEIFAMLNKPAMIHNKRRNLNPATGVTGVAPGVRSRCN